MTRDPELAMVDWRVVAMALLEHLDHAMELPSDLGEMAPEGDNDFQTGLYRRALVELGEELRDG